MDRQPEFKEAANQILESVRLPAFRPADAGPMVIAIEGPNGAGKTTLSWALSRSLGVPWCLGTDEAWAAEHLKTRMIRDADWFASAMFFLSGCFEQARLLRQRPDRMIIMDRSIWSTLAVHAASNVERLRALVEMLQPIAENIHVPHLTLVLEASFEACQDRIAGKSGTARALDELTASVEFHDREADFYRWLGRKSAAVIFLDTNRASAEEVAGRAAALLQSRLTGVS